MINSYYRPNFHWALALVLVAGSWASWAKAAEVECTKAAQAADAATALQSCFDAAPEGSAVVLPATVYLIHRPLIVQKSLIIKTKNLDPKHVCRENQDLLCAELRADASTVDVQRAFVQILADDVTVSQIVINGNKKDRYSTKAAKICANSDNGPGMNLHTQGSRLTLDQVSSINALCGTGAEISGASPGLKITGSFFAYNGIHRSMLWSDGLTIHNSLSGVIENNEFRDNTDVDLIFGGCSGCSIKNNLIVHSGAFETSSFAGAMFHAWPGGSGDYTQSVISGNKVDCANYRCGFGILVGASPWYAAPTFGGRYENNWVRGAESGFAINDVTGPVEIGVNTVEGSGGTFQTSAGIKKMPAQYRSAKSLRFIKWLPTAKPALWTDGDLTLAIPNWWTQPF